MAGLCTELLLGMCCGYDGYGFGSVDVLVVVGAGDKDGVIIGTLRLAPSCAWNCVGCERYGDLPSGG